MKSDIELSGIRQLIEYFYCFQGSSKTKCDQGHQTPCKELCHPAPDQQVMCSCPEGKVIDPEDSSRCIKGRSRCFFFYSSLYTLSNFKAFCKRELFNSLSLIWGNFIRGNLDLFVKRIDIYMMRYKSSNLLLLFKWVGIVLLYKKSFVSTLHPQCLCCVVLCSVCVCVLFMCEYIYNCVLLYQWVPIISCAFWGPLPSFISCKCTCTRLVFLVIAAICLFNTVYALFNCINKWLVLINLIELNTL